MSDVSLRPRWSVRLLVIGAALISLAPLAQLGASWWEYAQVLGLPLEETPPRGSVGVHWVDAEAGVTAAYVFPSGPAHEAGLRDGDRLVELDYQPYFQAQDVDGAIERATGVVLSLSVLRGDRALDLDVRVVRDPTFLYPLSGPLWTATGWGFALVALVQLMALLSVWPLAKRAKRARGVAILIGAALAWVAGNFGRHLWLTLFGAPSQAGPLASAAFDALTLVALAGWIAFPALLFRRALIDDRLLALASRGVRWMLWVPPVLLGASVVLATLTGHIGPLPPDAFVGPILYYVCVYVAVATALSVWHARRSPALATPEGETPEAAGVWRQAAGMFVTLLAAAGALFVVTGLPAFDDAVAAGWLIVALQLFSLLPVLLISAGTLRYGRFRTLLASGVATGAALSVVFVLVVAGALTLRALGLDLAGSGPVALGLWTVVLLLLADRLSPAVRRLISSAVPSPSQEGRRRLDRLGDRLRRFDTVEALARESVVVVGEALAARSAVVFLRDTDGESWVRAAHKPEPPHFTVDELDRAWDSVRAARGVWARNEELDDARLPEPLANRLRDIGVALAVPIKGGMGGPAGLIALSRKARRLSVYNVEEIEALQAFGAQLALASERLALLERERRLVRRTAEAELAALRAQINPHFLFNALNTIAALIAEKPQEAESTVESLAGLFRDVLTSSGKRFVPLSTELRLVTRYLDIEKARFGDRLTVEIDVAPEAGDVPVPAFAVQTLVENAVKHGVEQQRGGGEVSVHARFEPDALRIDVSDTGVGIPALFNGGDGAPDFKGVGLTNVSDRLRQLYDEPDRLTIRSSPDGTVATLQLPLP